MMRRREKQKEIFYVTQNGKIRCVNVCRCDFGNKEKKKHRIMCNIFIPFTLTLTHTQTNNRNQANEARIFYATLMTTVYFSHCCHWISLAVFMTFCNRIEAYIFIYARAVSTKLRLDSLNYISSPPHQMMNKHFPQWHIEIFIKFSGMILSN